MWGTKFLCLKEKGYWGREDAEVVEELLVVLRASWHLKLSWGTSFQKGLYLTQHCVTLSRNTFTLRGLAWRSY